MVLQPPVRATVRRFRSGSRTSSSWRNSRQLPRLQTDDRAGLLSRSSSTPLRVARHTPAGPRDRRSPGSGPPAAGDRCSSTGPRRSPTTARCCRPRGFEPPPSRPARCGSRRARGRGRPARGRRRGEWIAKVPRTPRARGHRRGRPRPRRGEAGADVARQARRESDCRKGIASSMLSRGARGGQSRDALATPGSRGAHWFVADDLASTEPTPAEASGLRGARLAARVRQALYHLPSTELADAHERMRQGSARAPSGLFPRRPSGDHPGAPLPDHAAARAAGLPALRHPHAAPRAAPPARALLRRPRGPRPPPARPRSRTSGSGPAGPRRFRRATRSSTGSTAWWTTPARSGRRRCGSWSPTSPASAGSTWCRRSRRWSTVPSCRC